MNKQIRDRIPKEDYEKVAKQVTQLAKVDRTTVFRLFTGSRDLTAGERVLVALCEIYDITPSMSRRGNCYDNAVVESFFGTLKMEEN